MAVSVLCLFSAAEMCLRVESRNESNIREQLAISVTPAIPEHMAGR